MNKQLWIYFEEILSKFEEILSKFQRGFRKGFSTQHCLLLMLEKWKHLVEKVTFLDPNLPDYLNHLIVHGKIS